MAKSRKKKKNQSFYKAIKPFVKDNRVLLSILGAAGAGAVLAATLGVEKVSKAVDRMSDLVSGLGQDKSASGKKRGSAK